MSGEGSRSGGSATGGSGRSGGSTGGPGGGGTRSGSAAGGSAGGGDRRRNEQGRERNRGGERKFSQAAPSQRSRRADPARLVAFEVLQAVATEDAYANLVLPTSIRKHKLDRRDAGFATELTYGALRGQGTYDAVLARCVDRPLGELDPAVLDALRIGAHQLLAMRVPAHAALDQTVGLVRAVIGAGPSSLVNAVLRKVTARDLEEWIGEIVSGVTDPTEITALTHSHPQWIVRALRQALVAHGREAGEIDALLAADNAAPLVHLVALPGLAEVEDVLEQGAQPGRLAPASAYYSGGDVSRLPGIAAGTVRVQDTGSQLVARALAAVPVLGGAAGEAGGRGGAPSDAGVGADDGADVGADVGSRPAGRERWLDLCAGPGGKTALLAALGQDSGVHVTAVEPVPHRAQLVRQALRVLPEGSWAVRVADGREVGSDQPDSYHRVLVDAPCTGLGALRRRPEARWRRKPADLVSLAPLQRALLGSALDAVAPGGVVAYVTCSPHHAETEAVVEDCLRRRRGFEVLDAGAALDAVSVGGPLGAGHGLGAQLWPHIHGTDAMYLALIRKQH